ncbi:MAG: hypothetical protein FWH38_00550 [Treponema sp.]|nr:hypothetical protein [Treponema sp.]
MMESAYGAAWPLIIQENGRPLISLLSGQAFFVPQVLAFIESSPPAENLIMFPLPACPPLAGLLPILRGKNSRYMTELADCMRWAYNRHVMPARLKLAYIAGKGRQRGRAAGRQEYLEFPAETNLPGNA